MAKKLTEKAPVKKAAATKPGTPKSSSGKKGSSAAKTAAKTAVVKPAILLYSESKQSYHACWDYEYNGAKDNPDYGDWTVVSQHDSVEEALDTIPKPKNPEDK